MTARAVVDTKVLVSGLIGGQSPPGQVVDAWLEGRFVLVTSVYQIEEVHHVLSCPRIASRIGLGSMDLEMFLAALLTRAEVVPGQLALPGVTRDPKDDPIVACARGGEVGFIVSGDGDLLELGEYEGIKVVTPRRFVELLGLGTQDMLSG